MKGSSPVSTAVNSITPTSSDNSWNEIEGISPRSKGSMGNSGCNTPRKPGISLLGLLHMARSPGSVSTAQFTPRERLLNDTPLTGLDSNASPFYSPSNPFLSSTSLALQDITAFGGKQRGPQVKPFIFAQAHQPTTNKPMPGTKCPVCEDHVQSKLQDEKIVSLKCGDFVHSECFQIMIYYEIEKLIESNSLNSFSDQFTLINQIFPICTGNECSMGDKQSPMLPVEDSYVDKIIMDAFSTQREHESKLKSNNLLALSSTLESNKSPEIKQVMDLGTSVSPLNTPSLSKNARPLFATSFSEPIVRSSSLHSKPSISAFLESSIYSRSPSPNSSISTMNTATIKVSNYKGIPLETLKNHFVQYLIDNCSKFSLSTLLKLGPLRLVDQLLVSTSRIKLFDLKICYLFTNYLVVWSTDDLYPIVFPLTPRFLVIDTPSPSIIKLKTTDINSKFREILLNSETDSIIEKWVVATSDFQFNFPSDILTSTIILPEFKKRSYHIDEVFFQKPGIHRYNSSSSIQSAKKSNSTIDVSKTDDGTPTTLNIPLDTSPKAGIGNSESDSDIEMITDALNITEDCDCTSINSLKCMNLVGSNKMVVLIEIDSDIDDDSDQEMIDHLLKKNGKQNEGVDSCENGWNELFADITHALTNNYQ